MADKVYIISKEQVKDTDLLKNLTPAQLEQMAYRVQTPEQVIQDLNTSYLYDRDKFYYVYKHILDEEIHVSLGKDDSQEVIVNKDLQIHINTNGGEGYNIDLYAYNEDTPYEERDFDKEFITSCYASFEELNEAREPETERA